MNSEIRKYSFQKDLCDIQKIFFVANLRKLKIKFVSKSLIYDDRYIMTPEIVMIQCRGVVMPKPRQKVYRLTEMNQMNFKKKKKKKK